MPIYQYHQNNTGGSFDNDKKLAANVFIEADSPDAADKKAESIGIYFDGTDDGTDCPCCGDRWNRASEHPAVEWTVESYSNDEWYRRYLKWRMDNLCVVYHADGTVTKYPVK